MSEPISSNWFEIAVSGVGSLILFALAWLKNSFYRLDDKTSSELDKLWKSHEEHKISQQIFREKIYSNMITKEDLQRVEDRLILAIDKSKSNESSN